LFQAQDNLSFYVSPKSEGQKQVGDVVTDEQAKLADQEQNEGDQGLKGEDEVPEKSLDTEEKPEQEKDLELKPEESEDKQKESEDKSEESDDKPEESDDKPEESDDKPEESDDKPEVCTDKSEVCTDKSAEEKGSHEDENVAENVGVEREEKVNFFFLCDQLRYFQGQSRVLDISLLLL
jgi:hypothetical protein